MSENWLLAILENAQPFHSDPIEDLLINRLLDVIDQHTPLGYDRQLALAAGFDLLVAAEYYGLVAHIGWLHCALPEPILIYPYTNTCPRCVLNHSFAFHRAHKPRSGTIGSITSRLLCRFLQVLLQRHERSVSIGRGREPVDAIFVDQSTEPTTVFFAEIKASPLVTLPLACFPELTGAEVGDQPRHHEAGVATLFDTDLWLFLPEFSDNTWHGQLYELGKKGDTDDTQWAYRGLTVLLSEPSFFASYLAFWRRAFHSYQNRDTQTPIYWLSNGCGKPVPRPDDWPSRASQGYESISDSKTSVGMDRTDDIKKATYQVLKLGTQGKPAHGYDYKVGIVSNIHAVRHFDEYLATLQNIVWTHEDTRSITQASHLPPETELFNLFDGIIALTHTIARDPWVEKVFDL